MTSFGSRGMIVRQKHSVFFAHRGNFTKWHSLFDEGKVKALQVVIAYPQRISMLEMFLWDSWPCWHDCITQFLTIFQGHFHAVNPPFYRTASGCFLLFQHLESTLQTVCENHSRSAVTEILKPACLAPHSWLGHIFPHSDSWCDH